MGTKNDIRKGEGGNHEKEESYLQNAGSYSGEDDYVGKKVKGNSKDDGRGLGRTVKASRVRGVKEY